MEEDYEIEEKKQAAADVLFQYSQFVMACVGNQIRPCDLRLHLIKEISGLPTSQRKESSQRTGESSSSYLPQSPKYLPQSPKYSTIAK